MNKRTGTTLTIVVAVLTPCCSMACCTDGIYTAASGGQWVDELDLPKAQDHNEASQHIEDFYGANTIFDNNAWHQYAGNKHV